MSLIKWKSTGYRSINILLLYEDYFTTVLKTPKQLYLQGIQGAISGILWAALCPLPSNSYTGILTPTPSEYI